jgi:hypothetical protein
MSVMSGIPTPFRLYVFFVTNNKRRRGLCRWLRLFSRTPKRAYFDALTLATELFTQCEFVHVCIGDGWRVADPGLDGGKVWPSEHFIDNYPNLAWGVEVPVGKPVAVAEYADPRPLNAAPTIMRHFMGGQQTRDCVQTACNMLRDAGIKVDQCTTPGDLFDWLRGQGYAYFPLVDMGEQEVTDDQIEAIQQDVEHQWQCLSRQSFCGS